MDPYSFLNTAHTAFFAELYNEYLLDPDSVEPSWRAFFQGFEFGIDKKSKNEDFLIPIKISFLLPKPAIFETENPEFDKLLLTCPAAVNVLKVP